MFKKLSVEEVTNLVSRPLFRKASQTKRGKLIAALYDLGVGEGLELKDSDITSKKGVKITYSLNREINKRLVASGQPARVFGVRTLSAGNSLVWRKS